MSTALPARVSDEVLIRSIDAYAEAAIRGQGMPTRLTEAMLYAALGPGKRVRPVLCVRACMAVNGGCLPERCATEAAAAVELVHAFSLVHDDLPAMDDDDLRRGRPTLHKAFDEATAVLAGDALQGLAMQRLAGIDRPWANQAAFELAKATNDMIAGQALDTLGGADGDDPMDDADRLERVHRLKTGALLRAACRIGALAGGARRVEPDDWEGKDDGEPWWGLDADDAGLKAVTSYADALGLMFQAVDDLLDVTSDAATLGKATQKDAEAGKLTYPGVFGVEGTRREIVRLHERAVAALAGFGLAADPLRALADRLATRTR
ncbi:MAG: polyprenyl synthetase family protein [Planctomycetota bacterium]